MDAKRDEVELTLAKMKAGTYRAPENKVCPECFGWAERVASCPLCLGVGTVPVDYGIRPEYMKRLRGRAAK